ncbi:MAG TPA: hypothetical protein VHA12_00620 [Candidatus Nanoarchaeia archaeon]|nr:hypothetical protein [Candidatus Nanoarchaeia archaeon]
MIKRGELTSTQIIMIVLAILGFLILLAFYMQLKTDNYTSDEVCKLSVVSRATAAEVKQGTQSLVPLQCTTSKICLVETSAGDCKQFVGEKNVVKIVLPKNKAKDAAGEEEQAREIEKQMANSMLNCWNMMGQGKLDLFGTLKEGYGFEQSKSRCVVCTRVAIGNDVSASVLGKVDVNRYMEKYTTPGSSLTYVQAMTDGATSSYSTFKGEGKGEVKQDNSVKIEDSAANETAFIFMQIKAKTIPEVLENQLTAAGVIGGGAFIAKPVAAVSATRLVFSNPYTAGAVALAAVGIAGYGSYNSWQSQIAATGYCGTFVSDNKEANKGCSLLQAFPYSVDNIRNLCGTLEGNI